MPHGIRAPDLDLMISTSQPPSRRKRRALFDSLTTSPRRGISDSPASICRTTRRPNQSEYVFGIYAATLPPPPHHRKEDNGMSVQKRTFCDSAPIGTFTEWIAGLASSRLKSLLEPLLHCRCVSLQVCVERLSLSPNLRLIRGTAKPHGISGARQFDGASARRGASQSSPVRSSVARVVVPQWTLLRADGNHRGNRNGGI
jgi:hypothetical protein